MSYFHFSMLFSFFLNFWFLVWPQSVESPWLLMTFGVLLEAPCSCQVTLTLDVSPKTELPAHRSDLWVSLWLQSCRGTGPASVSSLRWFFSLQELSCRAHIWIQGCTLLSLWTPQGSSLRTEQQQMWNGNGVCSLLWCCPLQPAMQCSALSHSLMFP